MSQEMILVINAGSSSLKFHWYEVAHLARAKPQDLTLRFAGHLSGIGSEQAYIQIRRADQTAVVERAARPGELSDLAAAQQFLAQWLSTSVERPPIAVGHRIVHGGPRMHESIIIDDESLDYLDALAPLAPLHQRNNLIPVHVIKAHWPDLLQVACFDTAFHRTQDEVVSRYALPDSFYQEGVRRYGFHGLSYQFISQYLRTELPDIHDQRVVVAHLGSGASAAMIQGGRSLDTTMGFTALDGLPMGTRPGRLDAGVVLWWMQQKKFDANEIQHLLYNCSGMKGLSGLSADMRTLLASDDPRAQLALDYYAHHCAECITGLGVVSQGIDALVFTAGVGENSPAIRARIVSRLSWLGAKLDKQRNESNSGRISTDDSKISIWVIPTNEEIVIARDALRLAQQHQKQTQRQSAID